MSRNEKHDRENGNELDLALAQVLSEPLDERQVEEAAARVWSRLAAGAAPGAGHGGSSTVGTGAPARPAVSAGLATPAGEAAALSGPQRCEDLRRQIPAYVRGELAPARALLLADHTRDCLPCRRALQLAKQGGAPAAAPAGAAAASRRPQVRNTAWRASLAMAALLLAGLGIGLLWRLGPWAGGSWGLGRGPAMARVAAIEGRLYRVAGAISVPVATGDAIGLGEQIRTAKGSRAMLRMNDGSQIEMAERAGLSLATGGDGNTIELERGRVIVQAAHQRPHHLFVATSDCLVSVTGTIFAVNHGTKGSRVSVVEGEVHVRQARLDSTNAATPVEAVLRPGDQVTTHASVEAVPVRQEVAWSRDAARYDALLAELTAAGQDIDRQVARPALRSSSRLLDLVPAGTLFYVALPNLASNLEQTQQLLEQRLAASPVLQQWWSETLGSAANEARFHELVQKIGDLGRAIGDEVVIAAGSSVTGASSQAGAPVLLAEAGNEARLRATLEQEIATVNQRAGKTVLVLLDRLPAAGQPAASPAAAGANQVLIWVGQGVLIASSSPAQLAAAGANLPRGTANPFVGSTFHARLQQAYADGAGWLFAADLKQLMASHRDDLQRTQRLADSTGIFDLDQFILERHDSAGGPSGQAGNGAATETRAALTFSQTRRGIASWLAAPAPMGSLGFFSPDANLVAAFVVKSPVELLDEILALSPDLSAELARAETEHGFNLRDDLAAPLGGEIALGFDGPLLPSPSWRLVAEVYDPVRLQQTFTRAVQQANAQLVAAGKPGVTLTEESAGGGRTYYAVSTAAGSQAPVEVHYVYVDGYLLAAPSRALLDQALSQRAAGITLASSPRLRGLLGHDGQVNVSALCYQNLAGLGPALGSLGAAVGRAEAAAHGNGARPGGLGAMLFGAGHGPSLFYAYAEADRIVFAGHNEAGPMGINLETLVGFGGILGGMEQAHSAALQRRGGS